MATARGQIQITDLNDGRQTYFQILPNKSETQVYNSSGMTYSPDYTKSPMVITPTLYVSGETANQMLNASKKPVWTVKEDGVTVYSNSATSPVSGSGYSAGASGPYELTITKNIADGKSRLDIECEAVYHDTQINSDITLKAYLTIIKNVNAGTLSFADIYPRSSSFLNSSEPPSINLTPKLNRGGEEDTTPSGGTDGTYTVEWYKDSTSGSAMVNESGKYAIDPTSGVLTVYPGGVDSINTFYVKLTDTSASSSTYGKSYVCSASITDLSDPYNVEILTADGRRQFKNGQGAAIVCTAQVKQGGNDVNSGVSYRWSVTNADGTIATVSGDTTSKTFTVTPSMVNGSALISCEVSIG